MPYRLGEGSEPSIEQRRRRRLDVVPMALDRRVRDQPRRPPRQFQPRREPSQTSRLASEEGHAYGAMGRSLQDALDARRDEMRARWIEHYSSVKRNQAIELARHEDQEQQLRNYKRSFEPEQPSADYMQATIYRGERPLAELKEEAREAEGAQRAAEFGRWWDRATPGEQLTLRGMAVGLIKENMRPEQYRRITEAARRDDDSIYEFDQDERERAARVYRGSAPTGAAPAIPIDHGPGQSFREKLGSVGTGIGDIVGGASEAATSFNRATLRPSIDLVQAPFEVGRELVQGDLGGARRELGEGIAPLREPIEAAIEIGRAAWQRDLDSLMDELDEAGREIPQVEELERAWRGVNRAFVGEQRIVTPFTRPLIHDTLTSLGVPDDRASSIAKYVAEVIVPSTFLTSGAGLLGKGKSAGAILRPLLAEGSINVLQNRAGHEARGESAPSLQEDIQMFAAGAAGRGGVELAGVAGGKLLRSEVGKRAVEALRHGEAGALRIFEAPRTPLDVKMGRHRLLTDAGDRLDWRETPDGGHIDDVTAVVEREGRGTALFDRAVSDIRARRPDAIVTADLNSEAGARLFARQASQRPGTVFTDVNGRQLTSGEAIAAAARREGPQVAIPLREAGEVAPEAPVRPAEPSEAAKPPVARPDAAEAIPPEGAAPPVEAVPAAPAAPVRVAPRRAVALATKPDKPIGRAVSFDRNKGGWWVARKAKNGKIRRVFYPSGRLVGVAEEPPPVAPTRLPGARGEEPPGGRPPSPPEGGPGAALPAPEPVQPVSKLRIKAGLDAFGRVAHLLKSSKRLAPKSRAGIQARLEAQAAKAAEATKGVLGKEEFGPEELVTAARGAMKGKRKFPIMGVTNDAGEVVAPRTLFTDREVTDMQRVIFEHYDGKVFDQTNATDALGLLMEGYSLAPHQARLLAPWLPKDVRQQLASVSKSIPAKIWREALAVLNLSRVLKTPLDVSMIGRQSFFAMPLAPLRWAKGSARGVRMLFDSRYTTQVAESVSKRPYYTTIRDFDEEFGRAISAIDDHLTGEAKIVAGPEEAVFTDEDALVNRLLLKTPVVGGALKRSSNSFSVGLAALRYDMAEKYYVLGKQAGRTEVEIIDDFKVIAHLSGRGSLGPGEHVAGEISQLSWAPRWLASRVQIPLDVLTRSKHARMLAVRGALGAAGTMAGILGMAELAGADIDVDSRSANFGKIKVGPTRLDVTAGFGPLIRFGTRLGVEWSGGRGMKDDLGRLVDWDTKQGLLRFIEGKAAPPVGIIQDIWTGETFTGEKLRWDVATVKREAWNRFAPFIVEATVDAVRQGGPLHAAFGIAEFVGLGTQSYTPGYVERAELIAEDVETGLIDPDDYPELDRRLPLDMGELHPQDRHAFKKRHTDRLEDITKQFGDSPTAAAVEQAEKFETEAATDVSDLADQVESGRITTAEFAEKVNDIQTSRRHQWEVVSGIMEAQGRDPDDNPELPGSLVQDLYDYGQIFDSHPEADLNDAERDAMRGDLDRFFERIGSARETRLRDNTSVGLRDVPLFVEYQDAKRLLHESGYFGRRDDAWAAVQEFALTRGDQLPNDPDDYQRQLTEQAIEERGFDPHTAADYAERNIYVRRWDRESSRALRDFIETDPEAIITAVRWGYKEELSRREVAILRRMGYDLSAGYIPPPDRGY